MRLVGDADVNQGSCLCLSPRQRGSSMRSPSPSPASTASSSIPCVLFVQLRGYLAHPEQPSLAHWNGSATIK